MSFEDVDGRAVAAYNQYTGKGLTQAKVPFDLRVPYKDYISVRLRLPDAYEGSRKKSFDAKLLEQDASGYYKYLICSYCFDVRVLELDAPAPKGFFVKTGLCKSCCDDALDCEHYNNCLYKAFLDAPLFGMDFERSVSATMLSFGYRCTFGKDGSIRIRSTISTMVRDKSCPKLDDDQGESIGTEAEVESYSDLEDATPIKEPVLSLEY